MHSFIEDLVDAFNLNKISQYDYKFYMCMISYCGHEYHIDEYLLDNLKNAYNNESIKYYNTALDNYTEFYEGIKDKIPYTFKSETKKFFENKISKMKYNIANSYYEEKDYEQAINYFKDYINDNNITNDIKSDCKYKLALSLYENGKEYNKQENYWDAKEYLEEAFNFLN